MPPVRLMGHLLPSRLPDKRGHHTYSKHSTSPDGGSTFLARLSQSGFEPKTLTLSKRVHGTDSCQQLSVTRCAWGQGGSLTVRDHDDDPNRQDS
jgi:hypothetical protein